MRGGVQAEKREEGQAEMRKERQVEIKGGQVQM